MRDKVQIFVKKREFIVLCINTMRKKRPLPFKKFHKVLYRVVWVWIFICKAQPLLEFTPALP